jgi:hypothetical protein
MAAAPDGLGTTPLRIFLVRHARPEVRRKGVFSQKQARQFILDYDAADIDINFQKPSGLPYGQVKKIYCSALKRSRRTAEAIFGSEMTLVEDPAFNEFERKILRLPLLRFPIDFWLGVSRALWLLGLNSKGIETFGQAQIRARKCAQHLAQQTQQEGQLVLVAHGFLNAFIRRELQQLGWKVIRKDGNRFLGVTVLENLTEQKKRENNIFTKREQRTQSIAL